MCLSVTDHPSDHFNPEKKKKKKKSGEANWLHPVTCLGWAPPAGRLSGARTAEQREQCSWCGAWLDVVMVWGCGGSEGYMGGGGVTEGG